MTAEEAKQYIDDCESSDEKPCRYFVVCVSSGDFEYRHEDKAERIRNDPEYGEQLLEEMATRMNDLYENEHFRDDFESTLFDIEDEARG